MKTCTRTFGYDAWNAPISGASNESDMLGGAESRSSPETFDRWFEAMLSTASLSSTVWRACSRSSDPTSVRRKLRVERSSKRTPSWSSRSATRRLTVEVGIFKRRAASEKLFASTTFAKIIREFRSVITILPFRQTSDSHLTLHSLKISQHIVRLLSNAQFGKDYPKFGKYIC